MSFISVRCRGASPVSYKHTSFGLTAGMNSLGKDAEFGADYEICAASSKIAGGLGIGGFIRFYGTVQLSRIPNRLDRYTFALPGHIIRSWGKDASTRSSDSARYEYWTLYKTSKFPAVSPDSSSAQRRFNAGITAGVRYWISRLPFVCVSRHGKFLQLSSAIIISFPIRLCQLLQSNLALILQFSLTNLLL